MRSRTDRLSGAFFLVFGLALFFLVIPEYVEDPQGGNLSPRTMPYVTAWVLAVCGGLLMLRPTNHAAPDAGFFLKAAAYVVVLGGSIYAMSLVGFLYVSPVLALIVMLMIGERRPLWLGVGVVLMPAAIWFLVTQLLERGLPG
ncbi:tripartite tricarboxylate transporter TctB family protein [Poseidonocella sedimentorum]|uniref:Putative tricarboxylic transport membrane protein n=1 Tax=Poseidonocella sedimentorum TaxID=871652 RepID=A0A1I6E6H0_9RHOB|nr:tripartite tricarboxylate transporter TctB family protein [Poseidonocella sedimentorum]SFR13306.1 putative tricarboxylic transport membrane protein [Poseidonocella sedimentorum]